MVTLCSCPHQGSTIFSEMMLHPCSNKKDFLGSQQKTERERTASRKVRGRGRTAVGEEGSHHFQTGNYREKRGMRIKESSNPKKRSPICSRLLHQELCGEARKLCGEARRGTGKVRERARPRAVPSAEYLKREQDGLRASPRRLRMTTATVR